MCLLTDSRGRERQSGSHHHHGFREGPAPLPRLQKELLKVGGSWRSAGFILVSLAIILYKLRPAQFHWNTRPNGNAEFSIVLKFFSRRTNTGNSSSVRHSKVANLCLKCTKIRSTAGIRPDPLGEHNPLSAMEGFLLKGRDISIDWPQDGAISLKYKTQREHRVPIVPTFFKCKTNTGNSSSFRHLKRCKFMPKMHQNTFGRREARIRWELKHPQGPLAAIKWILLLRGGRGRKGKREGRDVAPSLLRIVVCCCSCRMVYVRFVVSRWQVSTAEASVQSPMSVGSYG